MPITLEAAQQHVGAWEKKLGNYGFWAKHLFFCAHVTAAAKIIDAGYLLSRNEVGVIDHDIANQGALNVNRLAWDYCRLYFRPRTPFHLRTEGIKLLKDPYRQEFHMSVPIMFFFDLTKVVSLPGAGFCGRKMAHCGEIPGDDLKYFRAIEFDKVYHEAPIMDAALRQEIHDKRMAEVLVPGRISLTDCLDFIVCRTRFDALTLLKFVQDKTNPLLKKLRLATSPLKTFFCDGAYIDELSLRGDELTIRVKPSKNYTRNEDLKLSVSAQPVGLRGRQSFDGDRPLTNTPLTITGYRPAEAGSWVVRVEDCLAFSGQPPAGDASIIRR